FISYTSVIIILVGLGFAYSLYKKAFMHNTNFSEAYVYVRIPSDATYPQIQDSIKKYVKDYDALDSFFSKMGEKGKIGPGRYKIKNDATNYQIVRAFRRNV